MSTTSARARFTAVVTGGGSGIGAATAEVLAGRGGHVAVVGRSIDKLAATVRRIEAVGGQCRAYPADLHRAQEATLAVDSAAKWLGSIDVLVNCAGIYREGPFTELPDQVVDDLIDNSTVVICAGRRTLLPYKARTMCHEKEPSDATASCRARAAGQHARRGVSGLVREPPAVRAL